MGHHEEKKEKSEEKEAKVDPIKPGDKRGGPLVSMANRFPPCLRIGSPMSKCC